MPPRRRGNKTSTVIPRGRKKVNVAGSKGDGSQTLSRFLALPTEILEDILVLLAQCDSAPCLAALAATCRALRKLLYSPRDAFLWRRIFITTFDEPRSTILELGKQRFDCGAEYRNRIRAALFMIRHGVKDIDYRQVHGAQNDDDGQGSVPEFGSDFTFAFQTIISILDTSLPTTLLSGPMAEEQRPWQDSSLMDLPLHEAMRKAPKYPPRVVASPVPVDDLSEPGFSYSLTSQPSHSVLPSKNIAFLRRLFASTILPDPVDYLISSATRPRSSAWQSTPAAQAFHRLVATFGVLPFLATPFRPNAEELRELSDYRQQYDWRCKNEELTLFRSDIYVDGIRRGLRATREQYELMGEAWKTILREAQKKVYDFRYPHYRRAWGPFLPVPADVATYENGGPPRPPHPADLCADWEQLAAIRITVQARMTLNMRSADIFNPGVDAVSLEAAGFRLLSWENLRVGVWDPMSWVVERADAESEGGDGKQGSSSRHEAPHIPKSPTTPMLEWDWAGATGVWRHSHCEMEYWELQAQNRNNFSYGRVDDECHGLLLTLRVTGFSASSLAATDKRASSRRFNPEAFPTIHIEGTIAGQYWHRAVRHVKGTIKVCGDGSVWWSMICDPKDPQTDCAWCCQGIQIGAALERIPVGVRSGCGVLGLWTGMDEEARDDVDDAIGAWWQWRVA